jgi:oxalate decarboxylase/phosphoglucose isomerase-like protein (cupin superfamily)
MLLLQCTMTASHYDGSRNAIVMLTGTRRYILAHPDQCSALGLHPMGHPSARHSSLSWDVPSSSSSANNSTPTSLLGPIIKARVNEVVLHAGDVLYLPTHWFHMIVSLETNVQCNTRSGVDMRYSHYIHECGFHDHY